MKITTNSDENNNLKLQKNLKIAIKITLYFSILSLLLFFNKLFILYNIINIIDYE